MLEDGPHLIARHDNGQVLGPPSAHEVVEPGQVLLQYFTVEEQQRPQRLILGGGGDLALYGQGGEELGDLAGPHLSGMTLVMEEDVAPDPADVGFDRPPAVVAGLERVANAVEEFRRTARRVYNADHRAGAGR